MIQVSKPLFFFLIIVAVIGFLIFGGLMVASIEYRIELYKKKRERAKSLLESRLKKIEDIISKNSNNILALELQFKDKEKKEASKKSYQK